MCAPLCKSAVRHLTQQTCDTWYLSHLSCLISQDKLLPGKQFDLKKEKMKLHSVDSSQTSSLGIQDE